MYGVGEYGGTLVEVWVRGMSAGTVGRGGGMSAGGQRDGVGDCRLGLVCPLRELQLFGVHTSGWGFVVIFVDVRRVLVEVVRDCPEGDHEESGEQHDGVLKGGGADFAASGDGCHFDWWG